MPWKYLHQKMYRRKILASLLFLSGINVEKVGCSADHRPRNQRLFQVLGGGEASGGIHRKGSTCSKSQSLLAVQHYVFIMKEKKYFIFFFFVYFAFVPPLCRLELLRFFF